MKLFTRRAAVVVSAIAVLASVAACTAGGSTSDGNKDAAKGDVTLTFLTFETPNLTAAFWDEAIARTSALVPGVKIEKLVSPTVDRLTYAKQLSASGQLPDIMIAVSPADFAKAGSLAAFEQDELGDFISPTANQIDGKTYQLPWASQGIPFVYYNMDKFAEAGITAPPKTYADFLDACAKLKAKGITPIEIGGGGADTWSNSYPLVAAVGTDVYAKNPEFLADVKAGDASFSDPEFVGAAQKIVDLAKAGYLDKAGLSRTYANTEQAFRDGKAAMYPMGTWFPASADAKPTDFKLGVFTWPSDDGTAVMSAYTGGGITVSNKAADVDLAKKWAIAFSTDETNLHAQVKADGLFPAIAGVGVPSDVGEVFKESYDLYADALESATVVPAWTIESGSDAMPSGMMPDVYTGIADLINGKKTAEEYAAFLDQSYEKNSN
jgi:ABC-type glycerol-3-phosphate transport system substrate-binding protein